jgi:hypothetical protein
VVRPVQPTLRVDEAAVAAAESDIRDLLRRDQPLGPKFVRLGFHDCVGGCDGCVDLRNPDNGGLDFPIAALESIVEEHENLSIGFSRADIWALAALLGADMAQGNDRVDFSMQWVGRQNCQGSPEEGPNRELPPADITTAGLFHFFNEQFGFSDKETVALMGAHTLGSLSRENSGFDGANGWVRNNRILDNDYYAELVGTDRSSVEQLVDGAPPWFRTVENNQAMWVAFPPSADFPNGERILMLNADVSDGVGEGCYSRNFVLLLV